MCFCNLDMYILLLQTQMVVGRLVASHTPPGRTERSTSLACIWERRCLRRHAGAGASIQSGQQPASFGLSDRTFNRIDPDGLRRVATILVWARRFVAAFCLVQLVYRPANWPDSYAVYAPAFLLLVAASVNLIAGFERNR